MPLTPNALSATRRAEASKKSTLDIGKQTGLFDTPGVRQKVRKWQVQGGGIVDDQSHVDVPGLSGGERGGDKPPSRPRTPKDAIKDDGQATGKDGGDSARRQSPTKAGRSPQKDGSRSRTVIEVDHAQKAWVRRKSRPNNDIDDELRHVGTPKKRVVSDGHWRKDRTAPRITDSTLAEPPSRNKRDTLHSNRTSPTRHQDTSDGIRVRPMKHVSPDAKEPTPVSPSARDVARAPDASSRPKSSDSKYHSRSESDNDRTAKSKPRSSVPHTRQQAPGRLGTCPESSPAVKEPKPTGPDTPRTHVGIKNSEANGSSKPSTGKLVKGKHAKDAAASPKDKQPPAPPKVFANRIEAWLTETPDADEISIEQDESSRLSTRQDSFSADKDGPRRHGRPSRGSSKDLDTPIHGADAHTASPPASLNPTEINLSKTTLKQMPGVVKRRNFPSTGHRLSTIASVETLETRRTSPVPSELSEQATVVPEDLVCTTGATLGANTKTALKRRLTKHEDLISVLSLPINDSKSVVTGRSVRTSRSRKEVPTAQDLWSELAADEVKYQRELRTLVDGVIPVLLTCVLSKSDSAVAAGLFGRSMPSDVTITRPIVEMGIALERLKAHHRRIPKKDEGMLYAWAQGALRIYSDYLKAWRMGFQDVVVNLAPGPEKPQDGWDKDIPRNEDGDLVNGDGERVDVAFLLKRPLVRLKTLAKTFKGFNMAIPSTAAVAMAEKYQEIVVEARKRSNEERARLEDEAAASIDPCRTRDPKSLAPLAGVSIDATRCVSARDYFDMELRHSSGQQLDCKIELILRDDASGRGSSGDLLLCEISDTGRWLLFPPIRRELVSARNGDHLGDVVLMIRGMQPNGHEWQELMLLHANEDESGPEWVQMLGLEPVPPSLARVPSFLNHAITRTGNSDAALIPMPLVSISPPPKEVEVPIGEVASTISKTWSEDEYSTVERRSSPVSPKTIQRKSVPASISGGSSTIPSSPLREMYSSIESALSDTNVTSGGSSTPGLRRAKARRYRESPISPPRSPQPSAQDDYYQDHPLPLRPLRPAHSRTESELTWTSTASSSSQKKEYSVWLPSSRQPSDESDVSDDENNNLPCTPTRPSSHRKTSSVPSFDIPTIPKIRKSSSGINSDTSSVRETASSSEQNEKEGPVPSSAPAKLQRRQKSVSYDTDITRKAEAPTRTKSKRFSMPSFTPAFLRRHRRSSSPLKHQYEPSVTSASLSESESSDESDSELSETSESSDHESDQVSLAKSLSPERHVEELKQPTPPRSLASLATDTLSPSQSASQVPYRAVPQQSGTASRTVASIFAWSDRGAWVSQHPEECNIVVTPGLIEAFDMVQSNSLPAGLNDQSSPSTKGIKPIVAFELTPLVPLRRGTALDISIRSPPTAESLIRSSNNVMFRSRSPEECEALYSLINFARINNPTYIALQNARGPFNETTWAAAMDRRNDARTMSSSWWNLPSRKSSTYRSKGSRPASVATDSSVGTMNTAFSALQSFKAKNRFFNIGKSTITSRNGSHSAGSESLSSGSSTPMTVDPRLGTPVGITNMKIRLHVRESPTKWRDMGSARLTILLPPRSNQNGVANPWTTVQEKRIIIQGKTRNEVLLDEILGQPSFERVGRTGIAVSVWEENKGPNGELGRVNAVGGVTSSRAKTYMIQMKSVSGMSRPADFGYFPPPPHHLDQLTRSLGT